MSTFSLNSFEVGSPEWDLLKALMEIRATVGQCLWCRVLAEPGELGCINHQRIKLPSGSNEISSKSV